MSTDVIVRKNYDGIHLLRVIACFMVIFMHTNSPLFYQFTDYWNIVNIYNSFTRTCVLLFLMITGFLLLDRQDEIFSCYKKRLIKIVIPLVVYSAIYYLLEYKTLSGFAAKFFSGPVKFHLWYVYLIIGFYFCLPYMQKLYLYTTEREKRIYFILWFVFGVICYTIVRYSNSPCSPVVFNLNMFMGFSGYIFLGAYVKDIVVKNKYYLFISFVMSTSLIAYATSYYSKKIGSPSELFYEHTSIFVFCASLSLFMLLKDVTLKNNKRIQILSECSFGIYMIHVLIISLLDNVAHINIHMKPFWFMGPAQSLLVFVISFLIIHTLRRVKSLRIVVG